VSELRRPADGPRRSGTTSGLEDAPGPAAQDGGPALHGPGLDGAHGDGRHVEGREGSADAGADGPVGPMHRDGRYESVEPAAPDLRATIRRYVLVTKPRIIELLLITTVPAMVVGAGGWPGTWLVVATVLGGTMSAGSANALNNVLDRDIDRIMARTSSRPTATDGVSARGALVLGLALGVAGFVWLWLFVNLLAASLATFAILFYVFVYTLGLKRRTPQAVVIGGVAGCMPVMTGWAAIPGSTFADPRPWLLFGIMFWWQPPHFWALAMKYREDYARAGLPMLPVTHGNAEATRQILLHSYLLLAIVLMSVVGMGLGWLFAAPALVLTGVWLLIAHRLRRERTVEAAMGLFHYSVIYVALVFVAAAVAAVV
jgi:heme o synthase